VFLGVDIGTSSVKAVLVDERESIVGQAAMPLAVARPQPLFAEQDAQDWWLATVAAISALPLAARAAVCDSNHANTLGPAPEILAPSAS